MSLSSHVNAVTIELEHWLERNGRSSHYLRLKPLDGVRLLRLRVWATRHYLTVSQVLDMIMPVIRSRTGRVKSAGIGTTIGNLTGQAAYRILREEIAKRYPDEEHVELWREEEQNKHIAIEREAETGGLPVRHKSHSPLDYESIAEYVAQYKKSIATSNTLRTSLSSEQRRKPYRWNPWI